MLRALDLTRSFQAAKTPWHAVSKNDNEAIECAPHGFANAAFQDTLAALPIVLRGRRDRNRRWFEDRAAVNSKERHSHDPRRRAPLRTLARTSAFEDSGRLRIKAERT
jgi:hypothetical protein